MILFLFPRAERGFTAEFCSLLGGGSKQFCFDVPNGFDPASYCASGEDLTSTGGTLSLNTALCPDPNDPTSCQLDFSTTASPPFDLCCETAVVETKQCIRAVSATNQANLTVSTPVSRETNLCISGCTNNSPEGLLYHCDWQPKTTVSDPGSYAIHTMRVNTYKQDVTVTRLYDCANPSQHLWESATNNGAGYDWACESPNVDYWGPAPGGLPFSHCEPLDPLPVGDPGGGPQPDPAGGSKPASGSGTEPGMIPFVIDLGNRPSTTDTSPAGDGNPPGDTDPTPPNVTGIDATFMGVDANNDGDFADVGDTCEPPNHPNCITVDPTPAPTPTPGPTSTPDPNATPVPCDPATDPDGCGQETELCTDPAGCDQYLGSPIDTSGFDGQDYTASDVTRESIGTTITNRITSQVFPTLTINLNSSACFVDNVVDLTFLGEPAYNMKVDFCPYDGPLSSMKPIILSIATLFSIMIIFRGAR